MGGKEWTFRIGLQKTLVSLVLRSIPAALLWCGAVWLLMTFQIAISPRLGLMLVVMIGACIGAMLAWKLTETGFTGPVIMGLAWIFAGAVVMGGTALIEHLMALEDGLEGLGRFVFHCAGLIGAGMTIVWFVIADG